MEWIDLLQNGVMVEIVELPDAPDYGRGEPIYPKLITYLRDHYGW